jgi:hypothetical protein
MLEEMASVGDERIVSWQPHGKAFRVHQPEVFARTVMPRYFNKQTKYKSFQRQLHVYNFRRISKGMDTGAYFHTMFIRNKKAMSLRMSCKKIKGKKRSNDDAAVDHDHAASDPDFYSSGNNVNNNLTNVLQSDSILQACTTTTNEKKRGCSKRGGPATVFTAGSSDDHPDEEKQLLNCALQFNQEVPGCPSPPHQSIDWMYQTQTILSRDEQEQACSASEKGHDVSALLGGLNHQEKDGDEGFFAGKRFFCVERKTPLIEVFSPVAKGGGPTLGIFYMPRSA